MFLEEGVFFFLFAVLDLLEAESEVLFLLVAVRAVLEGVFWKGYGVSCLEEGI